jgi:uncharacterized protein YigA (DUF484 family)
MNESEERLEVALANLEYMTNLNSELQMKLEEAQAEISVYRSSMSALHHELARLRKELANRGSLSKEQKLRKHRRKLIELKDPSPAIKLQSIGHIRERVGQIRSSTDTLRHPE